MTKLLYVSIIASVIILSVFSNNAFAQSNPEPTSSLAPKLIMPQDIYVESTIPVSVNFIVTAIDDVDGQVPVNCDKTSGSMFKIVKTTIRCEAEDSEGNRITGNFLVTVGYEIVQIPLWVKQTTKFWIENSIDDKTYAQSIGFLIQEKIIKVPFAKTPNYSETEIPIWIKTNTTYWVEGDISDDEYSIMLQWLISRNMIVI